MYCAIIYFTVMYCTLMYCIVIYCTVMNCNLIFQGVYGLVNFLKHLKLLMYMFVHILSNHLITWYFLFECPLNLLAMTCESSSSCTLPKNYPALNLAWRYCIVMKVIFCKPSNGYWIKLQMHSGVAFDLFWSGPWTLRAFTLDIFSRELPGHCRGILIRLFTLPKKSLGKSFSLGNIYPCSGVGLKEKSPGFLRFSTLAGLNLPHLKWV